jgi:putative membrane protein
MSAELESKTLFPETEVPARPFAYFGCGVLMGICNVIPGGDSGTVALVVGIYQRIVNAISNVDAGLLRLLLKGDLRGVFNRLDLWFMGPLVAGVGFGIATMGTLMHYLIEHHFSIVMPVIFGLIAASCWMVAKLVERWHAMEIISLLIGTVLALFIVLQPGLSQPPEGLWYIVLCGLIGICALILPGISGAFILLFMGKYHDLTGVIDRATKLNFTGNDFSVLVAFAIGCALGLVGCSKFLKWLMEHHGSATMAALCGFKIGSLYKIWPYQVDTTPEIAEFKHKIFKPVPFNEMQFDGAFWMTLVLVAVAAFATLLLDHVALKKAEAVVHDDPDPPAPSAI